MNIGAVECDREEHNKHSPRQGSDERTDETALLLGSKVSIIINRERQHRELTNDTARFKRRRPGPVQSSSACVTGDRWAGGREGGPAGPTEPTRSRAVAAAVKYRPSLDQ